MDERNDFVWDKEELTPGRLMDRYDENLPQIIMVTEGFSGGGNEMHQFDRAEICWVNSIMRQACVLVKDAQGCLYSIPLDSCELFQVRKHHFQLTEEIPLQEALKRCQEQHDRLLVSNNDTVTVYSEDFSIDNEKLGFLEMLGKCERKYFLIHRIDSGEIQPERFAIPLYIPITAVIAVGLKEGNKTLFKAYKKNIKEKVASFMGRLPKLESVIMRVTEVPKSGVTYAEFTDETTRATGSEKEETEIDKPSRLRKAISEGNLFLRSGRTQPPNTKQRNREAPNTGAKPKTKKSPFFYRKKQDSTASFGGHASPIKLFCNLDKQGDAEQMPEDKGIADNDNGFSYDYVFHQPEEEAKKKELKQKLSQDEIQDISEYVQMENCEMVEPVKRNPANTKHPLNSSEAELSKETIDTICEEHPYEEISLPSEMKQVKPNPKQANVPRKMSQKVSRNHTSSDGEEEKPSPKKVNLPQQKPGTPPRPENFASVKKRIESFNKKPETTAETTSKERSNDTCPPHSEERVVHEKMMSMKQAAPIKPDDTICRAPATAAVPPFHSLPLQTAASSPESNSPTCDSGSQKWKSVSEIPLCIEDFSVDDVALALGLLNMEELAAAMKANNVDGTLLKRLDENILLVDFKCSGFSARQIDFFIKGWRPKT